MWLRDALALAAARFGSVALAKKRLREWMASGRLPWSCMSWKGLDAEGIATLDREQRDLIGRKDRGWIVLHIFPSVAYHECDSQFWRANLKIDWEDNGACEQATGGATALGIRVSHERLLALLPEEANNRVEELGQTKPAERKLIKPKAWFGEIREKHPRQQNEDQTTYAARLHVLMQEADVTTVWPIETLRRRLYK
jgi:hypothetical protein